MKNGMPKGNKPTREAIKKENSSSRRPTPRWQQWLVGVLIAIGGASAHAILSSYSDGLSHALKTLTTTSINWSEDHLKPMSNNMSIGVDVRFSNPNADSNQSSMEGTSFTVGSKKCKQDAGFSTTFERSASKESDGYVSFARAIIKISCRASGRIAVTLTPVNGTTHTIYDGIPTEWDQRPFPGVTGSYPYGIVTAFMVDPTPPSGPLVPINKTPPSPP